MIPKLSGALDHVHVYVTSRGDAADWYRDKLGFHIVEKFRFWAEEEGGPLTIADANGRVHFALFQKETPKPVSLAFGTNREEYTAWKAHLLKSGIDYREGDHDLSHSIYFYDPFGNELEITTYDIG